MSFDNDSDHPPAPTDGVGSPEGPLQAVPAESAAVPGAGATPPTAEAPAKSQAEGRGGSRFWREWGKPFLIILLIVGSFRSAVADWNDVPTGSMVPTILEGDRIFVNKVAYSLRFPFSQWHLVEWGEPNRGDIVVFFSPDDGKRLVKRVVGLPGDRIELRWNRLIVNGEVARYHELEMDEHDLEMAERQREVEFKTEELGGLEHALTWSPGRPVSRQARSFGPLIVPDGQYFVMGDNRDNSRDSRFFGSVDRELIVGRATAVAFSFDKSHGFTPRWTRFFDRLR